MTVTLIAHTPNPLYVCAEAASVCYNSEPNLKIVKGCIRSGHASVLEHATFTFRIEGISRACSHQLVRHRMASYSQQSQRYVKYDNLDWVEVGLNKDNIESINAVCDYSLLAYKNLISKGVPTEQARAVLPNATPTTIYVTMNVRALMNFFNERLCTRAQAEIRHLATSMKIEILAAKDISEEEKEIFNKLFVPKCEKYPTHFCPEIKGCGRHSQLKDFIEQKNGNWVTLPGAIENTFIIRCSECGVAQEINTFSFCPNCGAKMTR